MLFFVSFLLLYQKNMYLCAKKGIFGKFFVYFPIGKGIYR